MVSRILTFFRIGIWEMRLKDLPSVEAFFMRTLRIILLASRGFVRDNCQKTASVLTYYSLLKLVPGVAVAFAMAKGFGLEKLIEKEIHQGIPAEQKQPFRIFRHPADRLLITRMRSETLFQPGTAPRSGHHVISLVGSAICENGDSNDQRETQYSTVGQEYGSQQGNLALNHHSQEQQEISILQQQ